MVTQLCSWTPRLRRLPTRVRCLSRHTELFKSRFWETEFEHFRPGGEVRGWRGAVTSSSDQTTRRNHVGFQWTPSKISLQINKGHTSPAVDSDAVRGKKKYISLGRGYLFVELHAASRSISNHMIEGGCGGSGPQIRIWRMGNEAKRKRLFFLGRGDCRDWRGGWKQTKDVHAVPGLSVVQRRLSCIGGA